MIRSFVIVFSFLFLTHLIENTKHQFNLLVSSHRSPPPSFSLSLFMHMFNCAHANPLDQISIDLHSPQVIPPTSIPLMCNYMMHEFRLLLLLVSWDGLRGSPHQLLALHTLSSSYSTNPIRSLAYLISNIFPCAYQYNLQNLLPQRLAAMLQSKKRTQSKTSTYIHDG